ncbi:MAG: hypothetical protein JW821_06880 [Deltaproteobacteria bacterium]|nr:hypothetical protein [Deltaproteobacteria bacterium]
MQYFRFGIPAKSALIFVVLLAALSFTAEAQDTPSDQNIFAYLNEHFEHSLRILSFGIYQDPAQTTQNPGNAFLKLPRYRADLEVRPDIALNLERLHLSVKPRLKLQRRQWEEDVRSGEKQWDVEGFVNEWLFRVRVADGLFFSYGRENLQWGPAYLLSPSNPFFRDNGRSNPKQEVPGMDFARIVWLPGAAWTLSLIANTEEGRQPISPDLFQRTYALKADYTGQESYGSLVLSHREGDRTRLGMFGGWTATDALLLYGEGAFARGAGGLYPRTDDGPIGFGLYPVLEQSSSLEATVLLGASYTLELGPTLTLEAVHDSPGYNEGEADLFYRLRGSAAEAWEISGPGRALAARTLAQTSDPGLRLFRRNYLMFQVQENDIRDLLNLTFRWTQNLDDHSGQFISMAEVFLGDHLGLFSIGTVNAGGGETEFGSILDLQWMIGLEYTF